MPNRFSSQTAPVSARSAHIPSPPPLDAPASAAADPYGFAAARPLSPTRTPLASSLKSSTLLFSRLRGTHSDAYGSPASYPNRKQGGSKQPGERDHAERLHARL
jgi:hypothetical protein